MAKKKKRGEKTLPLSSRREDNATERVIFPALQDFLQEVYQARVSLF